MIPLDVVLRDGAVVLDPLLGQKVRGVSLLQERIPHVFFVSENLVDSTGVPFGLARAGENAISLEARSDLVHAFTFEVFPVDPLDDLRLRRIDDQMPIGIFGVAEEAHPYRL